MAVCSKCGTGSMVKKMSTVGEWFYCKRHGYMKPVGKPFYKMITKF